MDHASLPARTRSKRARSSIPSRESPRAPRPPSSSSNSTPLRLQPRPPLAARTNSAPLVPLSRGQVRPEPHVRLDEYSPRDSVSSIKDDPFFRNYQSPHSVSLGRELTSASHEYSKSLRDDDDDDRAREPARWPLADKTLELPAQSRSGMADINIAVVGSAGVGKSTLIQRALGLRTLPTSILSSLRVSVDNIVYTVSLIELELESFDIDPERRIQWPKQINGHIMPRIDGALLLYDVMNRESIAELPQTLNALVNSSLPTILVSCKCDNPESSRQIDVESMESACLSCVEAVKFASTVPESARLCLSSMMRAVMADRAASPVDPPNAHQRASSINLDKPLDPALSRPLSGHSRASSEWSILRGFPSPPPTNLRGLPPIPRGNGRSSLQYNFMIPNPQEAPPLSAHPAFRHDDTDSYNDSPLEFDPSADSRSISTTYTTNAAENSFLDMEESDAESIYRYSDSVPILQRSDESFYEKPVRLAGVTFDELVDRLLGEHISRADHNFSDIFLCLYRKFAAPSELFGAILNRLESIADDKNTHYLTRSATQLRIITIVAKWVANYPGDFASNMTSRNLDTFITHMSTEPLFAAAAQDMRAQLQSRVVRDDDTGWARTDDDIERESGSNMGSAPPSPVRRKTKPSAGLVDDMGHLHIGGELGEDMERMVSLAESANSAQSMSPSFHTVEDYEREAATMVPNDTLPLTKFRYDIFIGISDDDFADEITRIDWVMFSSIRVRDFVRHVSLSLELKEKCKSLANVNRMVKHFNHIAKWVAEMILLREKAKHRARVLEKYMMIALKLRKLNNYNGLAAVLAGINSSAVHRLAQTRALVPTDVQKQFARLVLLMGTQKSHFAYRLAWENSPLPRIPFMPLHRRDLVSAEEGSRTFVGANGDRINWKKFEILAEVLLPMMRSQVTPYPNLTKREEAASEILDCKLSLDDEDVVYQRSLQLESSSGPGEAGKKKLPWFQKEK